jgi:RNase P subunit RPR2
MEIPMKSEMDSRESGQTTHGVQVATVKVYSASGKDKKPGDIIFRCKLCNKKYRLAEDFAGIAAECAKCKKILVVPRHSDMSEDSLRDRITFRCHECSQKYRLPKIFANQKARCSRCHSFFIIPEQSEVTQPVIIPAKASDAQNEKSSNSLPARQNIAPAASTDTPSKNIPDRDNREEVVQAALASRGSRTQTTVEISEEGATVVKYVLVQPVSNIFESVFHSLNHLFQQIFSHPKS